MSEINSSGEVCYINNFLLSGYFVTEMYRPSYIFGRRALYPEQGVYYERDLDQKTKLKFCLGH